VKKMANIKFKNVTKRFGKFTAVDNLNLEVMDREFVCFVGPSGCGKTTCLRMLAGLEEITSGQISIDGQIINELLPKDRNIAMVFQSYALYPHYTIYDNLAFGLRNRHKKKKKKKKETKEQKELKKKQKQKESKEQKKLRIQHEKENREYNLQFGKLLLSLMKMGLYGIGTLFYWLICRFALNAIPFLNQNEMQNVDSVENLTGNLFFAAGILGFIIMMLMFSETRHDINKWISSIGSRLFKSIKKLEEEETLIQTKVHETAKLLSIETQLWKKPKQLSGGQRQRVALGRAIIRNPKAFLMDEPLSNLDAKLRVQMRAELERLTNRLKVTTLYVTHDQIEAMTLSDRIAVMNEGIVDQLGTPDEVYNLPVNLFVAGFIGSPSMNFVSGKVQKMNENYLFVSKAFSYPVPTRYIEGIDAYDQKEVVLGIRPEHMSLVQANSADPKIVTGVVGVLEPIGAETYVYVDFPDMIEIIFKVEGIMKFKIDEQISIKFIDEHLHFFDKEAGNRILPTGGTTLTHHEIELAKQEEKREEATN
jgi:multiple sugar transport system ATP-binding protein